MLALRVAVVPDDMVTGGHGESRLPTALVFPSPQPSPRRSQQMLSRDRGEEREIFFASLGFQERDII